MKCLRPNCTSQRLDGHLTCGDVFCDEAGARDELAPAIQHAKRLVTIDRDNALRFAGVDDLAPLSVERVQIERVCAGCLKTPITYEMDITQLHGVPFLHPTRPSIRTSYAGGHLCRDCATKILDALRGGAS